MCIDRFNAELNETQLNEMTVGTVIYIHWSWIITLNWKMIP